MGFDVNGVLSMLGKTKRIYSFDVLRILSACAVIMIHISADIIKEFDNSTIDFVFGNALNALSRFAVPVFLMISGALMLEENKKTSTEKIIKSALNILILTFSWSLIYTLLYNVIKPVVFGESILISNIIHTFFNGHYHMWYLYVLVGLYLVTPLLRFFIKKENSKLIRNYLLLSIVICFLFSFVNAFSNICFSGQDEISYFISNFRFDYLYEYLVYYVMGWYIVNVGLTKKLRVLIYVAGVASLVTTFITTQLFYSPEESHYFHSNDSLNIFIYGVSIFTFVYQLFKKNEAPLSSFWIKISNLTFGVYLIHCIYLFIFKFISERFDSSVIGIIVTFTGSVLLSFITVFIISKIPVVKKLIRG